MGKLRFTLTYLLFWVIIVFSCLLAENFAFLSSNPMGGMSTDSLILLSIFLIAVLIFYYFQERRKNGVTFDKILLPIFIVFTIVAILTICWQEPRQFSAPGSEEVYEVAFTAKDKLSFSLQVVVWFAVLYGLVFVSNRFAISRKWTRWLAYLYIFGLLACSIADIIMEFNSIVAILTSTYEGPGLQFVIYNSNVWGHLLLVGLLSCIIMCLRRFKPFYYVLMIHFLIMIVLTSCATATFVGLAVIVLYSLYEIFALFNKQRHKSVSLLLIYISVILFVILFSTLMIVLDVPVFSNVWYFIYNHILHKDYSTLTSRTGIWSSVFHLLRDNPRDFIFGLGYRTGNMIFTTYYEIHESGFAARSAHNGLFEIFLRHGLLGVIVYIAALSLFLVGLIKLIKKKEYRVAYFYGICVIGILIHSVAESTMFFTPNIGGTYLTLFFFLPVANEVKDKHFAKLKEELANEEDVPVEKGNVLYFVSVMTMGLIIAFGTTLVIRTLYQSLVALIVYIVLTAASIIALFVLVFVSTRKDKVSFKEAFKALVIKPIKNHYLALVITLGIALLVGFIFPLIFEYDLFATLLFTIFVYVFYNCAQAFFDEKNNYLLFSYFDYHFKGRLKKISLGVRK